MAQSFQLDGNQYFHLEDRSSYNHNYYQHHTTGQIIYEECDGLHVEFRFYEIVGNEKIWLGASEQDITEGLITIHPDWL
jgi:hypothetical protein